MTDRKSSPGWAGVAFAALRLGTGAWLRALQAGGPRRLGVEERLEHLAVSDAPLDHPVRIRWDGHQIPFIVAESDDDLAVALGVVHAHLRLAQIEMMRRVATGRLSEVIGAAGVGIDHTLRTLDFRRAGGQAADALSPRARAWMEGFLKGLNHQIAHQAELPHEFRVLGISPEPWSFEELMAVSRLASTDFTWKIWMRLMKLRGRSDWNEVWARLLGSDVLPEPSLAAGSDPVFEGLESFGRGGSNAYALSGARTASGKPILAGDPHLPIQLPNLWLVVGMKSPGYHAVGMMVPAVPVLGLGRNPHIAWGGTNLHAASSELVDLGGEDPGTFRSRTEHIRVRGGADRRVTVRDSDYGPVVSDAPLLRMANGPAVALHWMGHRPSDEVTAFLDAARATDWESFVSAIDGYAIPALNMIYADAEGHIGQVMAAKLPRRPHEDATDFVSTREALDHWENMVSARDLPLERDPAWGFVASANNAPPPTDVSISRYFSPDDRVKRLREVLGQAEATGVADIARLQLDVVSRPAAALRDRLLPLLDGEAKAPGDLLAALRGWEGAYDKESAGALAFELLVHELVHRLHEGQAREVYLASWDPWALLDRDLRTLPGDRLRAAVAESARAAAAPFRKFRVWGGVHRLRLAHSFAFMPLIRSRYVYEERPVSGGNETLMKTRHGFSNARHRVGFGSQARHISDLADPDENHFVLLGGQDGWLGSSSFIDQAALWREGRHVRVPLRVETVEAEFPHLTELRPAAGSG